MGKVARLREEPLRWSDLRGHLSWPNLRAAYGVCVVAPAVIGFVVLLVWGLAAGIIMQPSPDLEYRAQLRALFEFSDLPATQRPAERKELAKWLLFLQGQGVRTDVIGGWGTLYSGDEKLKASESGALDQDIAVLRRVAATGETPAYPEPSNQILDKITQHLPLLAWSIALLHLGLPLHLYASFSARQKAYLVDLPWRAVWPVALVMLTIVPLGLPFYVVSVLRMHVVRRHEPPELLAYKNDPPAGKQAYALLRTAKWQEYLTAHMTEVNKLLDGVEGTLQTLGERLRNEQRTRNTLISEMDKIASLREQGRETPEPRTIDDEFGELLRTPGVTGAGAADGCLSVLVCARFAHEETIYDLGDWDIQVSPIRGLRAVELRAGVRPDWPFGRYPVYRLGDGSFCFGEHSAEIGAAMKQGRILEAVQLAVMYIQSVNVEHRTDIEKAFLAVREGPSIIL